MNRFLHFHHPVLSFLAVLVAPALFGATVYVSPTGSGTAAGSFDDPYDLATGLAQGNSGEIRFLPGSYLLMSRIDLRDNTTYAGWKGDRDEPAGLEGRDAVIIDGQATVACLALNANGSGTTVRDLTIRNAKAEEGALAKFQTVSGTMLVTNCVFRDTTSGKGCVITTSRHATEAGSLTFADCDFRDITATAGSAADASCGVFKPYGTLFLRCRIFNNTQTCNAYSALGYGSSDFTDCVISNNTGISGGGYRATKATFTRCLFAGNSMKGGGLVTSINSSSKIVFTGCIFTNNVNTASGACIGTDGYTLTGGQLYVTNCVFVANETTGGNGGAIGIDKNGWTVRIVGCAFTNNLAMSTANQAGQGGAVFLQATTRNNDALIKGCDFYGNQAKQSGGAVVGRWAQGVTVENCTFTTNVCAAGGGAFCQTSGSSGEVRNSHVLIGCTFKNNVAAYRSAAYLTGAVTNCTFIGNNETGSSSNGTLGLIGNPPYDKTYYWTNRVAGCTFIGNKGRGIMPDGDDLFVTDTTIRETNGGAFDLRSVKNFLVERCNIVSNTTSGQGAAVWQTWAGSSNAKDGRFRNTLFVGNSNTGSYGGGGAATVSVADNIYFESCTFVENCSKTGLFGALQIALPTGGTGPTDVARVINSLFYRNQGTHGYGNATYSQFNASGVWTNVYYNCYSWIGGLPPDRNNINATTAAGNKDPKFEDFAANDFRLTKKSPCVNVGSNETWMVGASDIRGKRKFARIQGGTVDIGCYEYRATPGVILLVR